ncbi:hypothetical protein BDZ88DRAFT_450247 [Geranomyces variabilis]|nr:hypothetical protein BDZ88DRAFT_450247 [Geranomyces variabilis]KAJ3136611.1 hypothetical protein HDU90_002987 [Geranomyces variabilis]
MLVSSPQLPRTPHKAQSHADGGSGAGGNGGGGRRTSPVNGNGSRGGRGGGRRSRTPPHNNNANANNAAKGPQQQQHHQQKHQQNGASASRQKPASPRATVSQPATTTSANVAHISNGAAHRQPASSTPTALNNSAISHTATIKASVTAPHAAPAAQPACGSPAAAGQRRQTSPAPILPAYQRPILPASPPRPLTVPSVPPAHDIVRPQAEVHKSRVNLASRWNIDPKSKPKTASVTPAHTGPPPFNYQEVVDYMNKAWIRLTTGPNAPPVYRDTSRGSRGRAKRMQTRWGNESSTRPDILEKILAFEKPRD